MTTIRIVDYSSGNLHSALKSFQRMADETGAAPVAVSSDPNAIRRASRIVLPGVGALADCRAGLAAVPGLFEAIAERVIRGGAPFLGICVGQQLMAARGLEHGETPGFHWIPGDVVRIAPADPALKVPHIGWNALNLLAPHPVLAGITQATTPTSSTPTTSSPPTRRTVSPWPTMAAPSPPPSPATTSSAPSSTRRRARPPASASSPNFLAWKP